MTRIKIEDLPRDTMLDMGELAGILGSNIRTTKDSHDRFSNNETSYLLLRIEQHANITALATNLTK